MDSEETTLTDLERQPTPGRWKRLLSGLLSPRRRLLFSALLDTALALALLVLVLYLSCPGVDHLVKQNPATTALIEARKAQGRIPRKFPSLRPGWVPLEQVPDLVQKTVIVAEDAGFFGHAGIDWYEVKEAFRQNLRGGRSMRGASTITQQLAKNLYLSEDRSIVRKLREWIIAGRLEDTLSKRRILDLYLNVIELGPGVFGIGNAAQAFFGKSVGSLSLGEAVRLAAVIPQPLSLSPNRASARLEYRARIVLGRLRRFAYITPEAYTAADQELTAFFRTTTRED